MKLLPHFARTARNTFRSKSLWLTSLVELVYPNLCVSCNQPLYKGEVAVCTKCRTQLPYTRFHDDKENIVAKLFWGRTRIENATSYFYFRKGSRFQKILHAIKYQNGEQVGMEVGKWFGGELKMSVFNQVDCIIPVPLHPKKFKKRGYNQSERIARGISETLGKPLITDALQRVVENPTQTRKSRYARWANVEGIFEVSKPQLLTNKHILIVDDVVTTGSTLEACAQALLKIENVKVSIATLAVA